MTPERWQQVKQVFDAALRRDAHARSVYLKEACGHDNERQREVERLLHEHGAAGRFMASAGPEFALAAPPTAKLDVGASAAATALQSARPPGGAMPAPDAFPGYEVLGELSRGGQGVVFTAIQQSTKRKVAIKVLLEGQYASAAVRRRRPGFVQTHGQTDQT